MAVTITEIVENGVPYRIVEGVETDLYIKESLLKPPQPPSPTERVAALENENAFLVLELATTQARLEQTEQEQADLILALVEGGVL